MLKLMDKKIFVILPSKYFVYLDSWPICLFTDSFLADGGHNRSQSELPVFGLYNVAVLQHRCGMYVHKVSVHYFY